MNAVQGRVEVYVDGGIRTGIDVFKALALGARAVFIGRPAIWGLAYKVCINYVSWAFAVVCCESDLLLTIACLILHKLVL